MVCYRTLDVLPDPPGRVGGEPAPFPPVVAFNGLHQTNVCFLNEVIQREPGPEILPRNRKGQSEVADDHPFACSLLFPDCHDKFPAVIHALCSIGKSHQESSGKACLLQRLFTTGNVFTSLLQFCCGGEKKGRHFVGISISAVIRIRPVLSRGFVLLRRFRPGTVQLCICMAGKDTSGCFLNQHEPGRPAGQRADCLLPCVLDCARGFYFLLIRKKRIGPHLALIVAKRISRIPDEILQKGHCLIEELFIIISQPEGRILRDDFTFNDPDSKVMGHNFQCQFKVMVNITACSCTDIHDTPPGKHACQHSLRK